MTKSLADRESRILAAAQHRAGVPISKIAKIAGCHASQVHYSLRRLKSKEIIYGQNLTVDLYPLGLTFFSFALSIHAEQQSQLEKLMKTLLAAPSIAFLGLVSGDFQYIGTACAERIDDIWRLLARLCGTLGPFVHEKAIGAHLSFKAFGRRYLTPRKMEYPTFAYGARHAKRYQLTPLEHKILKALCEDSSRSLRDVSRMIQEPVTTIHRHLKSLTEAGIVTGEILRISLGSLGAVQYKLLLYTRGISERLTESLLAFCEREREVVRFIACVGAWDYEVDIELVGAEALPEFQQRLFREFGSVLNSIKSLQIIKHLKFDSFPVPAPE